MPRDKSRKSFFQRLRSFLITTVVGGFAVVLPIALLVAVIQFLWNFLSGVLSPMHGLINFPIGIESWIVDLSSVLIIVVAFFLIGLAVRTGLGKRIHSIIDNKVLSQIPFYATLRATVQQFFGRKKMPFSQVVIADVMNTKMTGFVTDEREDGTYTIFVPTAPNPTNGFIFHVKKRQLDFLDIRADEAMSTIFGMGTGSSMLFNPPTTPRGSRPSP
jgi:uncharacterized membrane protein